MLPEIINSLRDFAFKVFVMRPQIDGNISVFDNTDISPVYGSHSNFQLYLKLFRFAKKNKTCIHHGFNLGPFVLLFLRLAGATKIVYSIQGTIYWESIIQKIVRKSIWYLALKSKPILIANSEWSKKRFAEQVSDKLEIQVIYNPINLERFNCVKRNRRNPQTIIYSGRLDEGKNLFRWLNSAKRIAEVYPDIRFILYGSGPFRTKLEKYVEQLDISKKVKFYGFKKNIEEAYKESDLLLFLSEYESFGNVVVESILCGTPVIAADIPSMREIFINYLEFLVPLDNHTEDSVLSMVENYPTLKQLALKASEEFRNRFSNTEHFKKLVKIYSNQIT